MSACLELSRGGVRSDDEEMSSCSSLFCYGLFLIDEERKRFERIFSEERYGSKIKSSKKFSHLKLILPFAVVTIGSVKKDCILE